MSGAAQIPSFLQQDFGIPSVTGEPSIRDLLPEPVKEPQRVLLLSDVHGNWPALHAVLAHAQGRYDIIWFLGDMVGYGPYPLECLAFLCDYIPADQWCAGNHDLGLFDRVPDFTWSGAAGETIRRHATEIQDRRPDLWTWADEHFVLSRGGPVMRTYGKGQLVFTHANLENDMNTYLFPAATFHTRPNLLRLREFLPQPAETGWLLAGHTHIPCLFHLPTQADDFTQARPISIRWGEPVMVNQGHYYINPGSVGQPRDGNQRACYVILDTIGQQAIWYRVPYELNKTLMQMNALGYPPYVRDMLIDGGTERTKQELLPFYQSEVSGIIALDSKFL
ncbi:metallophosphoesterase family protein [Candidatus Kaiserbacteria bacterium]|nr:metallophosphoesterase family protein [Candidatus Kaiserbacteria bacterium]